VVSGDHDGRSIMLSRELARGWLAITSATLLGDMAKASRVLAALMRDGWVEARRRGSHRVLVKGHLQRVWAYLTGPTWAARRWRAWASSSATRLSSCADCRTVS